jgi:DNA modification methylase
MIGQKAVNGVSFGDCKNKDLVGIPFLLALALRSDGWYLRQDIIWSKTNPMPESVKDRCVKSHEYIFLLSKSPRYYFDYESIKEPSAESSKARAESAARTGNGVRYGGKKYAERKEIFFATKSGGMYDYRETRNKRDVWTVPTTPYKGAHFATFPVELITPCVLAGCPAGGTVLDPFAGAGTTGVVAAKYNLNYILIDINAEYMDMARRRIERTANESFGDKKTGEA